MELRIDNNRGFYSSKIMVSEEEIRLVHSVDKKFTLFVFFQNGTIKQRIKIINDIFKIPKNLFFDGVLLTNIEIYLQGSLIKRIPCDKLIIQDVDKELKVIPEITGNEPVP